MNDGKNAELHQLAYRYYLGELSYESYRSERTRLIDRLTQQIEDGSDSDDTQPMLDKKRLMQSDSKRGHQSVWIVMAILLMIAVVMFVWKSGWIATSLVQLEPKSPIEYAYAPEISRQ